MVILNNGANIQIFHEKAQTLTSFKVLMFEKTQINLLFCSLNRTFAPIISKL